MEKERDRVFWHGLFIAVVSFCCAMYEAFTKPSSNVALLLGFGLAFVAGIFIIVTRHKRAP